MREQSKIIYNADGVEFTICLVQKPLKAGVRTYWLLADHSTGKRRLLSHSTLEASEKRTDDIRAAMTKGRADRLLLSNAEWQDAVLATEIVHSAVTGDSLASAVRSWAKCVAMLGGRANLLEAVRFYLANRANGAPPSKPHGGFRRRSLDFARRNVQFLLPS
jgi:hypothetical protein